MISMEPIVVRKYTSWSGGNILVPLSELLAKIPVHDIELWGIRWLTYVGAVPPLGISIQEFEKLTATLEKGLLLGKRDFELLLKPDHQIIDGIFDGYINFDGRPPKLTIECVDSTLWEVTTDASDISEPLRQWIDS